MPKRLSEKKVRRIMELHRSEYSGRAIANDTRVPINTVYRVIARQKKLIAAANATPVPTPPESGGQAPARQHISDAEFKNIVNNANDAIDKRNDEKMVFEYEKVEKPRPLKDAVAGLMEKFLAAPEGTERITEALVLVSVHKDGNGEYRVRFLQSVETKPVAAYIALQQALKIVGDEYGSEIIRGHGKWKTAA